MVDELDLTELKKVAQEYIDYLGSKDCNEDRASAYDHYIAEAALAALFGKDVFDDYINKIL